MKTIPSIRTKIASIESAEIMLKIPRQWRLILFNRITFHFAPRCWSIGFSKLPEYGGEFYDKYLWVGPFLFNWFGK